MITNEYDFYRHQARKHVTRTIRNIETLRKQTWAQICKPWFDAAAEGR